MSALKRSTAEMFRGGEGPSGGGTDPKRVKLNQDITGTVIILIGDTGITNVSGANIASAIKAQHPLTADVLPTDMLIYPNVIELYANNGGSCSMALSIKPDDTTFRNREQKFDVGIIGSSNGHLTMGWPKEVITNHPIQGDATGPIIRTNTQGGGFLYVQFTVKKKQYIDLFAAPGFKEMYDVLDKKRMIKHVKDLKLPALDE